MWMCHIFIGLVRREPGFVACGKIGADQPALSHRLQGQRICFCCQEIFKAILMQNFIILPRLCS